MLSLVKGKKSMSAPDFDKTAADYAQHRQGFPGEFFQRIMQLGIGLPRQVILDLGTGTGTIARVLAREGCKVIGLDISNDLLEAARQLDKKNDANVEYYLAPAEETGLPDDFFDVVIAGQCWHWFNHPKAIKEVKRLLRPGGRLVIAHIDWLPLKDSIPALSESLITQHNPQWTMGGGNGFYTQWVDMLAEAHFQAIETFSFDVLVPYTHDAWLGRIRASAGISASLGPEAVLAFNEEHRTQLKKQFPEATLMVPHRCFAVIADV